MLGLRLLLFMALWTVRRATGVGSDQEEAKYTEEERLAEYEKRGYDWPIPGDTFIPKTEGWRKLMQSRIDQIKANEDTQQKWDGFLQTLASAITVPNHTEFGWGLSHAPESLTDELRSAIFEGLPNARLEGKIEVIDGPMPYFIDRPDLTQKVLTEVKPILEAWSGLELVPSTAYGFRLYRNESRLWMHIDKTQTHVISCIYHIASEEGSKPWPVVIEDYDGNTNSVVLKPGDLLLYESAKNFHGRPSFFNGEWYTSVFVHFYPKNGWKTINRDIESTFAVPPEWWNIVPNKLPKLQWVGTSALEPECPDSWCRLADALTLEGPGEYGTVLTSRGKMFSLGLDSKDTEKSSEEENFAGTEL